MCPHSLATDVHLRFRQSSKNIIWFRYVQMFKMFSNFIHHHVSSLQNPSIIPFHPGWLIGIPQSWITIIPKILNSITPYNHQPTGVLPILSSHPTITTSPVMQKTRVSGARPSGRGPIQIWQNYNNNLAELSYIHRNMYIYIYNAYLFIYHCICVCI